jgi:hypothetical protein
LLLSTIFEDVRTRQLPSAEFLERVQAHLSAVGKEAAKNLSPTPLKPVNPDDNPQLTAMNRPMSLRELTSALKVALENKEESKN